MAHTTKTYGSSHARSSALVYICVNLCVCVCVYVYVCARVCVCMCVYVCIYRFCSDKPLPPTTWSREVQRLNVIVIEAQSFANLVESGAAALTDIDILVRDV